MSRKTKAAVFFLSIILAAFVFMPTAYANAAESPSLTIIVLSPPDDLHISIRLSDNETTKAVELFKDRKGWETYYRFYWSDMPGTAWSERTFDGATLIVQSEEKSFERQLPASTGARYSGILKLDMSTESITDGHTQGRTILLISMRVVTTIIIEGLIFLAFGYRKKESWIVFLFINFLTQTILNSVFTNPYMSYMWVFGFILLEVFVFAVEALVLAFGLQEGTKGMAVMFALTANFASLLIGGWMISNLPV